MARWHITDYPNLWHGDLRTVPPYEFRTTTLTDTFLGASRQRMCVRESAHVKIRDVA
jgi:hypothetical protein